jgi:hypothetical protein
VDMNVGQASLWDALSHEEKAAIRKIALGYGNDVRAAALRSPRREHRIVPEWAQAIVRLVLAAALLAAFSPQVRAQTCPPGYKSAAGACVQTCPGGYEDRGRICIYRRQGD